MDKDARHNVAHWITCESCYRWGFEKHGYQAPPFEERIPEKKPEDAGVWQPRITAQERTGAARIIWRLRGGRGVVNSRKQPPKNRYYAHLRSQAKRQRWLDRTSGLGPRSQGDKARQHAEASFSPSLQRQLRIDQLAAEYLTATPERRREIEAELQHLG